MAQSELLRHLRLGVETVRGTGVTPDWIVPIESAEYDQDIPLIRSPNVSGDLFQQPAVMAGVEINRIKVKTGLINGDRIQRLLACCVDSALASTGAQADKTWGAAGAIKPPALSTTATLTSTLPKSLTAQIGFANPAAAMPAQQVTGMLIERLKFISPRAGWVQAEFDLVSEKVATDLTAFTGTLTPDVITWAPAAAGFACYIDVAGGTIGATADTNVKDFEVEYTAPWVVDETGTKVGIGRLTNVAAKFTRFFEAADQLAAWRSKAEQKIRAKWTGPVLGSGTYLFSVDLYGVCGARSLGNISGFVSEEITLESRKDATAGTDIGFGLVNAVSAV